MVSDEHRVIALERRIEDLTRRLSRLRQRRRAGRQSEWAGWASGEGQRGDPVPWLPVGPVLVVVHVLGASGPGARVHIEYDIRGDSSFALDLGDRFADFAGDAKFYSITSSESYRCTVPDIAPPHLRAAVFGVGNPPTLTVTQNL